MERERERTPQHIGRHHGIFACWVSLYQAALYLWSKKCFFPPRQMFLIDFRLEIKRGDKSGKLSDVVFISRDHLSISSPLDKNSAAACKNGEKKSARANNKSRLIPPQKKKFLVASRDAILLKARRTTM